MSAKWLGFIGVLSCVLQMTVAITEFDGLSGLSEPDIDCNDLVYGDCSKTCGIGSRIVTSVCGADHYEAKEVCCNQPCTGTGGAQNIMMHVTCDNIVKVWVGGVNVLSNDDWEEVSVVNIGSAPVLVAIHCTDLHSIGGILAHFSNGEVTDEQWKCTHDMIDDNWNHPDFDDSLWPNAIEISPYATSVYWGGQPLGMTGNPFWIWTDGWTGGHREVYCRKVIAGGGSSGGSTRFCKDYPPYNELP